MSYTIEYYIWCKDNSWENIIRVADKVRLVGIFIKGEFEKIEVTRLLDYSGTTEAGEM